MNNDFTARGDLGNGRPERDRRGASPDAPLTDREVPLGLARTPVAVHQWLDGDLPESTVRQGEMVRHVEFWNRVGAQAEARRQLRTPEYLTAQIMQADFSDPPEALREPAGHVRVGDEAGVPAPLVRAP